jgi:hypothetical protein
MTSLFIDDNDVMVSSSVTRGLPFHDLSPSRTSDCSDSHPHLDGNSSAEQDLELEDDDDDKIQPAVLPFLLPAEIPELLPLDIDYRLPPKPTTPPADVHPLSPVEIASIKHYVTVVETGGTNAAYDKHTANYLEALAAALDNTGAPPPEPLLSRHNCSILIERLSGLQPQWYNMGVDGCRGYMDVWCNNLVCTHVKTHTVPITPSIDIEMGAAAASGVVEEEVEGRS